MHIIFFNPLNAELNPICHLLTLLGGATIVVVSRLRVKSISYHIIHKVCLQHVSAVLVAIIPDDGHKRDNPK
jgi:hypothetical protein